MRTPDTKAYWDKLPRLKPSYCKISIEIKQEETSFTTDFPDFETLDEGFSSFLSEEASTKIDESPENNVQQKRNERFEEINFELFTMNSMQETNERVETFALDFSDQMCLFPHLKEFSKENEGISGDFWKEWEERSTELRRRNRLIKNYQTLFPSF